MELHHSVTEQVLQLCMDLLNSGLEENITKLTKLNWRKNSLSCFASYSNNSYDFTKWCCDKMLTIYDRK